VKRLLLAAFLFVAIAAPAHAASAPKVLAIHFTEDVNPVTQDWLNGRLSHAESHG
jgi:membrane-bound ClpP family serine protease